MVEVAEGAAARARRHERVNGQWNRFYGVIIPPIHAEHEKRPFKHFSRGKENLRYEAKPEKSHDNVKLSGSRLSGVHEQYFDTEHMWLLSFLS